MAQQERVADDVYFFQSTQYAQVTAGVVVGPDMAVVIDTLAFPEETIKIREFIERELQVPVRYVINTHYHADHSWGNYFFPGAKILAHSLCSTLLKERGIPALKEAKEQNPIFRPVKIVLPQITFTDGSLGLQVGKKTLKLIHFPGHSPDSIAVLIEEDRVMFAGDTFMALPYLVDGDIEDSISSLKMASRMGLENIVQGHGDIILRGEIDGAVKENLDYLSAVRKAVRNAARRKYPLDLLETVDVESCGKSRVIMGGLTEELHRRNLVALYQQFYGEVPKGSEVYFLEE